MVEPRVPDPKENPVAMAALGAKASARVERPRTLLSLHCRRGTCHIAGAQRVPGGKLNPKRRRGKARAEWAEPQANACATPPARRTH